LELNRCRAEVPKQRHLGRKRRAALAIFWRIRGDHGDQVLPGDDLLHLLKEFTLAALLGGEIQAEVECCIGRDAAAPGTHVQAHALVIYAELL
jgi:hypothetical protein